MKLNLTDEHAQMGKIANNIGSHGDEEVSAFAIPFELMLPAEQLDELMGKYFHRSLFNTDAATQLETPIEGFRRCAPLQLEDVWEEVHVVIGDSVVEHEFTDCRVSKCVLEPQVGGLTKLRAQVYLRPGLGEKNLWLQECQHTEVGVEITAGKIAKKKNPVQQSLPLPPPADEKPAETGDGFEAVAKAQVDAFNAKGGEVIDGRSERVKHQDRQRNRESEPA